MATRTFDVTVNHVQWDDDRAWTEGPAGFGKGLWVVGSSAATGGTPGKARIFLKFDTNWSSMHAINSATLHMKINDALGVPVDLELKAITANWSAGSMTWATMPGTAVSTLRTESDSSGWVTYSITDIIKYYAPTDIAGGGGNSNFGLMIRMEVETNADALNYYSISDAGSEPYITVNYDVNTGPNAPTLTEPDNEEVVNDTTPNFEFTHDDDQSNVISAYQVQVRQQGSGSDWSTLIWDSTKTSTSDETPSVTCGVTLNRGTRYLFRARTWDEHDVAGTWSGGRGFTIASLPVGTVTSPGTDVAAPLAYTAGSDTTPHFQVTWTFSCAEGGTQASADIKVYDSAGSSLLHTHAHSGSAVTANLTGYLPTNGTKYQISVTPVCSHGATGSESAKKRCQVRWGRAAYRADLGAAPVSLSVAVASTLNSGQIIMEYGSHTATTPEPTDWKGDISEVTKNRYVWHRVTILPQAVASPTSPQLLSVIFTYSALSLTPDNWSLASIASIDVGTYVYGTQSLKHAGDGTSKTSTQTVSVVEDTNYVLSGRIKTQGTATATIELFDTTASAVVATVSASNDTDWTRYQTDVWNSGSNSTIQVRVRTQGSGTAWFDALKLEASTVVTPWTPGFLGNAVTLDAGGVQIDALAGGVFRLRGSTGGTRDVISLDQTGLEFGGDTELDSPSAGVLAIDGQIVGLREAALRGQRATSNQSIANNTATTLIYNSNVGEDDEEADLSLNTSTGVVTVARAGWYAVTGGCRWANNTTGNRHIFVVHQGNTVARSSVEAGGEQWYQNIATLLLCAASDTIEIQVSQDSGGNLDIVQSAHNFIGIHRIRPD